MCKKKSNKISIRLFDKCEKQEGEIKMLKHEIECLMDEISTLRDRLAICHDNEDFLLGLWKPALSTNGKERMFAPRNYGYHYIGSNEFDKLIELMDKYGFECEEEWKREEWKREEEKKEH